MSELEIDIGTTPFSRRGSYFAISRLSKPDRTGVFLRTLHGDARKRELLRFLVGEAETPVARATPGRLVLSGADSEAEIALDGEGRAIMRVMRGSLTLDIQVSSRYDVVLQDQPNAWRYVASGANSNYRIVVSGGTAKLDAGWDGLKGTTARLTITAGDAPAVATIDAYMITAPATTPADFDTISAAARREFEAWSAQHGRVTGDTGLDAGSQLAAYVTWSAMVPPGGMLRRESMLMSKNDMAHIWSWDHCFNAMALWRDPGAAADQLLTLFDHQDADGGLPDHIDDARIQPNFVKPPVHGWAIGYLMDRGGLAEAALAELYAPLGRWTDWWFAHRVYGDDGVPSYNHGNDSGWDNSTVFAIGVPMQSPDLLAYLALQQHTLARMADQLGLGDGPAWRQRAEATTALLISHFWRGDRFVGRHTLTRQEVDTQSLLPFMPLVLGDKLPRAQFETLVARLLEGGFMAPHGAATEAMTSPYYEADGYWRGPIWAPTTMLLIDGLRRGGRGDIADDLARRFLSICAAAGMAENFDAQTGAGLRDRAMTWTASVYLTLLAELHD